MADRVRRDVEAYAALKGTLRQYRLASEDVLPHMPSIVHALAAWLDVDTLLS